MAKKKTTDPRIVRLMRFYRIGQKAVKQSSKSEGTYARGVIAKIAAEEDLPVSTVDKCRLFAERFNEADFKELCGLRRTADDKVLGWGYVTRVITIAPKKRARRQALLRRAAKHDWTVKQLNEAAIQLNEEFRLSENIEPRPGGNRHRKPDSIEDAYQQIEAVCEPWIRWSTNFAEPLTDDEDKANKDSMPKAVRDRIDVIDKAMKYLAMRCRKELGQ